VPTKRPQPFLAIDRKILADSGTSGESAKNLHVLCDEIGPRFAGTDGYRAAADFMLDAFKRYKLDNAELEGFDFLAWRRGEPATLTMKEPFDRPYPCYALPGGAPTGPDGAEAEVIDIGPGSNEDIKANRKGIKGRFVITSATAQHRTGIFERCAALGATGFILGSNVEGMVLPTGTVTDGERSTIPAIGIGHESALQIQRFAKENTLRFRITLNASFEQATTWNVVGELIGTEFPDELVIMGGHLDSHEIGPGALDNAAGAVQVMEAARLLAKHRKHLKRTVRFIGFAAEEVGLLGSHHHAKKHSAQLRKARFMLNSDCPSLGSPKGLAFHRCPGATPYVNMLSKQMETPISLGDRFHCNSDHYPFILQGLPTAGMGGGRFSPKIRHYVHMAADTLDKISLTDLREGAAFAARILLRAASDEDWPRMRRSPAQVKKLLASQ
jgi:hypothetical protein